MTAEDLAEWITRHRYTQEQAAIVLKLSLDGLKKKLSGARAVGPQTELICAYVDKFGLLRAA